MTYSVKAYGALPNGTLCTKAIQAAIDACFLAGGGEVVIPEGEYLVGGLRLRSGVTLHLMENAVLMGSIDPEDYTDYINDTVEPISEAERNAPTPTAKAGAELWQDSYPYSRWNNAIIRAIHAQNIAIIGERGSEICGQNCFDEHAFVVKKGERIRMDISSSAYPHYVPHTNEKGLFSEQKTARVATNTVILEKSFLLLPIEENVEAL